MKAMQDACGNPENYKYSLADLPELLEAVCYRYEKDSEYISVQMK